MRGFTAEELSDTVSMRLRAGRWRIGVAGSG